MNQRDLLGHKDKNKDISCTVIKSILAFYSKSHDRDVLRELLKQIGLDLDFLENEDNWISYEKYLLVLNKLVEESCNPHLAYASGISLFNDDSFNFLYFLLSILKVFSDPKAAYDKIIEYRSLFYHVDTFEVLSRKRNKIRIKYSLIPGLTPSTLHCDVIKGQLAAVPRIWNFPLAKVKELQCQAQGGEYCLFEIIWPSGTLKKIFIGLGLVSFIGIQFIYFLFFKQPFITLKDIAISGLVCSLGYLLFCFFAYRRRFTSQREVYEKRAKALETAIYESKHKYRELEQANQQIIEKANKLAIINKISAELIKTNFEDVLLKDVLKLIVENRDFDVGFCLFLDNNLRFMRKPCIYIKTLGVEDVNMNLDEFFIKKGLADIIERKIPQVVQSDHLFNNVRRKEILVIPLCIQNYFYYLMLFYNYSAEKKIDRGDLDFFNTIAYQLEISLDNIYTTKAAKAIITGLPSSLVLFNGYSLKISYINPTCCKTMTITLGKALGKNIISFLKIKDPFLKNSFQDYIKQALQSRIVDGQELKTGNEIIGFTLFKMPALFGSGDEIGMIMKNITEQKEMKEQLFRAEKLAALGTLVSGIAHEINNPLYGILGLAEIIMDETEECKVKTYTKDMIDFVTQASDIVKDLSSYSRDMREDKPKLLDINLVLDDALRIVKYSKNFIGINVKKKYKKLTPLYTRAGELRQIYINLFNNAVQAMGGKGTLTIVTKNSKGAVETHISDTGIGMAEDILPKIFDPFFTTRETARGTGLGLHIVYRLVTQNNGVISVQSTPGKGTTFKIKYFLNKENSGLKDGK